MQWFEVDKEGLGKLLERKGKAFAVFELVQNALDEKTTLVNVKLERVPRSPFTTLTVEDDNPAGFADLTHAFTLFADSSKKGDAEKRGRFNLGEKLVLALCSEARIVSTTGTVIFGPDGRTRSRAKRESGSLFAGTLRMTDDEIAECAQSIKQLIPPAGIITRFNGEEIASRIPVATFDLTLPTDIADAGGVLRRTQRKTQIRVFEPIGGEVPKLYELGIPVVATMDRWHIDIGQKVPLNFERDAVPPAYLSKVRAAVVEQMADRLTGDDANSTWVRDAIQTHGASMDAATVNQLVGLRFGDKRVAYDPSDREANFIAVSKGYTLIHGAQLSKPEWDAVRRTGAVLPAGQVTPSPRPYSEDGPPVKVIPKDKWTPAMLAVADYARRLANVVLGCDIEVRVVHTTNNFDAAYGGRRLDFNLLRLGKAWFAGQRHKIDELLIHEFAHEYASNHLSAEYHEALCRVGAGFVKAALDRPALFDGVGEARGA